MVVANILLMVLEYYQVRLVQGMDMHEWIVGFHRVMDDCKQGSQIAVVADKDYNDCYPSCLMVMPYKEPCHLQQV